MRSDKDRQGIALIAVVSVIMVALLVAKATIGTPPKADAANCVGNPDVNTVVVLDRSEKVSTQTLNEIRARAMAFIYDSTVQNELVSVFTVSDLSKNSLVPLIALCRPPASGNRMIENVQIIETQFRDKFQAPLDTALSVQPGNTEESPIAQALIDISRTKYLRGKKNTLLIFSDMLENTSAFTLYGCDSQKDVVPRFRASRVGAVERPSFKNTRVVLNLIPRLAQSAASLKCRDTLWVWFFGDNPGPNAGVDVDYLPGGVPIGTSTDQGTE